MIWPGTINDNDSWKQVEDWIGHVVESATNLGLSVRRPIAALTEAHAGTGGTSVRTFYESTNSLSSVAQAIANDVQRANASALLAIARSTLSLSVTDVARSLQVERPTVYSWLSGISSPTPEHWDRLRALTTLGFKWFLLTRTELGAKLTKPLASGKTLRDLLAEGDYSGAPVDAALLELARDASAVVGQPLWRDSNLREIPNSTAAIDRETGKRLSYDD